MIKERPSCSLSEPPCGDVTGSQSPRCRCRGHKAAATRGRDPHVCDCAEVVLQWFSRARLSASLRRVVELHSASELDELSFFATLRKLSQGGTCPLLGKLHICCETLSDQLFPLGVRCLLETQASFSGRFLGQLLDALRYSGCIVLLPMLA